MFGEIFNHEITIISLNKIILKRLPVNLFEILAYTAGDVEVALVDRLDGHHVAPVQADVCVRALSTALWHQTAQLTLSTHLHLHKDTPTVVSILGSSVVKVSGLICNLTNSLSFS